MILSVVAAGAVTAHNPPERMDWWREARFGMFIHWGLYSVLEGEYNGRTDQAEWVMETSKIPVEEYEKNVGKFNPTKFNAKTWAKLAKDAGMKYVVITTKHHDGFDLFDSKVSNYTIKATPYKKDIMAQLAPAVRAEGLKMCWYHSIMDWHNPDYTPARPWNSRQGGQTNLDQYDKYLKAQVSEVLSNYGPIGVMWFDGEWESSWNSKYGKELYDLCRKLQPDVIVNNRVSTSRGGAMGYTGEAEVGDFSTPEQEVPAKGLPGVDWESCITMNDHWGWNKNDHHWKSSLDLIHLLSDVASKGGNLLLNIGPRPDGTFPGEAVTRLHDIGAWMKVNGESIYGTTASQFDALGWGRSTTKLGDDHTTLYFQVFEKPADGKLVVPGIGNEIKSASLLGSGATVSAVRSGPNMVLTLPETKDECPVIKVEIAGKPAIYRTPVITASNQMLVNSATVSFDTGGSNVEVRYTTDGSAPTTSSPLAGQPIEVHDTTTVKAASFFNGQIVSDIASLTLQKVTPAPATALDATAAGLSCSEYTGTWETMPDWSTLTPRSSFVGELGFPSVGTVPEEHVGRHYVGYVKVPTDEVYTFALTSDDGSRLSVDGQLVVDNDGLHSSATKAGEAALAAGLHKIEISWFNNSGGAELKLDWGVAGKKLKRAVADDFVH
jgi:alpha-L-fucosidase